MAYDWDFTVVWDYRSALLTGLLVSFALTVVSAIVGIILALPLALLGSSGNTFVRSAFSLLIDLLRALPLLPVLVWAYYVLPSLAGLTLSAMTTSILVFSVNFGVFAADVLRGAIRAIPQAHVDSCLALGMNYRQLAFRLLIPETFRRSAVPLNALLITLFKFTSLASVIGARELQFRTSMIIVERPRPLELYTAMLVLYVLVIVPISLLHKRLEDSRWMKLEPTSSS